MNALILHPERDFLNPSNPSSPYSYAKGKRKIITEHIIENHYLFYGMYCVLIEDEFYEALSLKDLLQNVLSEKIIKYWTY